MEVSSNVVVVVVVVAISSSRARPLWRMPPIFWAGFGDPLIALAVETPTIMVAKRACTADITILGVVANEDDDHHDAKDDDNDARGALITEERCVKAIVLEPHGHEAWGAAILLLDTIAPLHRQRRGRASSPRRSLSRAMTRLKDTYRSY